MTRRQRWLLLPLGGLTLVLVLFVVLFDWSWVKGIAEDRASAALGRPITIGDLDVDLGLVPTITIHDAELANADWASEQPMARIARAAVDVDLLALIGGEIVLPKVVVEEPDVLLEQGDGRSNWSLGNNRPSSGGGDPTIPVIGDLQVTSATIRYVDQVQNQSLSTRLEKVTGHAPEQGAIRLQANGQLGDAPLELNFTGESRGLVGSAGTSTPFSLQAKLGEQTIGIDGETTDLTTADALHGTVQVDGTPPAELLALLDLDPSALEPVDLDAEIRRDGETLRLVRLSAKVGDSDISGDGAVDFGSRPLAINGKFRSDQVEIEQLLEFWAVANEGNGRQEIDRTLAEARATLDQAEAEQAREDRQGPVEEKSAEAEDLANTGLPELPFSFSQLPPWMVDVAYEAGLIRSQEFQIENLRAKARLKDKVPGLTAQAEGSYGGQSIIVDVRLGPETGASASPYPVEAEVEAGATRLSLDGALQQPAALEGIDVRFDASSSDLNQLLATAGIEVPPVPAFKASGHLLREVRGPIELRDFQAQVGDSRLGGSASLDRSGPTPLLTARLTAEELYATDFMPAEQDQQTSSAVPADPRGSGSIIKDGRLNLDALPELDLDVGFEGRVVEVPEFRFEPIKLHLRLADKTPVIVGSGEGSFRYSLLTFDVRLGDEQYLEDPSAPYPLDVQLDVAETRLAAKGTVARPDGLTGLDVDVNVEGNNLDRIGDVLQLPLPASPPYALAGELTHQGRTWTIDGMQGKIGDSDLDGRFSIDLGQERPTIVAELHSARLDFDDLAPLIGAPPDTGEGETAAPAQEQQAEQRDDRLLPDEKIEAPDLRTMDARVTFRGDNVDAQKLPLEGAFIDLYLEDGKLRLDPLRFGLAGGTLVTTVELDATPKPIEGTIDIAVREIDIQRLLGNFDIEIAEIETQKEGQGLLFGRTRLQVAGNSIAEMLGHADGQFGLIMDGGRINALIVEGLGLDVGEALGLMIAEEEERRQAMVAVNCLVANFDIADGVMESKALVLDTDDSKIVGAGQIMLDKEQLDLRFKALPRDNSVLSAGTPVAAAGSFASPEVEVVSDELVEKGFTAAALGVVLPIVGAVIPFIEVGENVPNNCATLVEQASQATGAGTTETPSDGSSN